MQPEVGLVGQDLYLRLNGGKVQCFRVWDSKLFISSIVQRKNDLDGQPLSIILASPAEYRESMQSAQREQNRGTET